MIRRALRELLENLPLAARGLRLVWRAARPWTVVWCVLLLAQGLVPAAQVSLTRSAVNGLAGALGGPDPFAGVASAWLPIALIALLWLGGQILASVAAWVRAVQAELVQDHVQELIHRQAASLDLAFFDDPDSHDLLHRVSLDAVQRPVALLESFGAFFQSALTLAALAALLAAYAPWLPLLLLGSALPGLWVVGGHVLREHRWRVEATGDERLASYYDWVQTQGETAPELRLLDLGAHFRRSYRAVRARLRAGRLRLARAELRSEAAAAVVAWGGGLAGMAWMLSRAARGLARLGDLVLCYQAFQQGQSLLRSLLGSTGQIYRSALFLEDLFRFLALEPRVASPPRPKAPPFPLRAGARFEAVTFRYPGAPRDALAGCTLDVEAGRVTAVVGRNGSGKSTLVKLLCRLYDPREGRILLDGADLREMDLAALRRRVAVLFQEPVRYHATAGENIALGALADSPGQEAVAAAARAAGADDVVGRLPLGYATLLGRWLGGAELSVGEWQRLALARACLREAAVTALDEPTSAMDSWAEAAWLERLRRLAPGGTLLVITHRFTTAMRADVIHVIDGGRIVESGTHAALCARGGGYAASWEAQTRAAADPRSPGSL